MSRAKESVITADWPLAHEADGVIRSIDTENGIEIAFDCQNFGPKEVMVSVIDDKLDIHCRHEKADGASTLKREFARTYVIPKSLNCKSVKHQLNKNGELVVTIDRI
uniref:SHSP domain-containing protein n=1 Tax=Rhabditophanes sp. KR3021 TaxID=114890 RepID=A0AC35TGK1_9BILA